MVWKPRDITEAERIIEMVAGNAGSALAIALIAVVAGRLLRRPAVNRLLWLLAPPLVELAILPAVPATTGRCATSR